MNRDQLVHHIQALKVDRGPVVVALSGGVDSGLVAWAAYEVCGSSAVAVTVHSELVADRDYTRAVEVAEHIGIEHHPLPLRLLENTVLRRNTMDRCYHCKLQIYRMMLLEYGDTCCILDGTTADDDPARPGRRAAVETGVCSPLKDAGFDKQAVRDLARDVGLPNWNAPSESCLATRIPLGVPLCSKALDRVQTMESFWHARGVETLRAVHDNLVATVSIKTQYIKIAEKNRDKFAALIEQIGLRSYRVEEWTG